MTRQPPEAVCGCVAEPSALPLMPPRGPGRDDGRCATTIRVAASESRSWLARSTSDCRDQRPTRCVAMAREIPVVAGQHRWFRAAWQKPAERGMLCRSAVR
jgi:hypothetical protein